MMFLLPAPLFLHLCFPGLSWRPTVILSPACAPFPSSCSLLSRLLWGGGRSEHAAVSPPPASRLRHPVLCPAPAPRTQRPALSPLLLSDSSPVTMLPAPLVALRSPRVAAGDMDTKSRRAALSTARGRRHFTEGLFLPMFVRHSLGRTLVPRVPILLTDSGPLMELRLYFWHSVGSEAETFKTKNIVKYKIYSLALRSFTSTWG